jgi:zinc/manganese transport system substrate-binding protein
MNRSKRFPGVLRVLGVFGVLGLLLGTARPADAKVRIVTTVQTFRSLAQEVGGADVEVTALVGDNVDPHFVDPKPSYALLLNKAELLVYVGLDLEQGWLPPLIQQSRNPKIQAGKPGNLDASSVGIQIRDAGGPTSHALGDIHPKGNPHYWLPPQNARRVARAIADRLKAIDGEHANAYELRFQAFAKRLDAKEKAWALKAKPLAGMGVVTYHKSWSYLTDWLALKEIGYIEPKPGIPPDPAHLAQLVTEAKRQQAREVIVESYYPRNTAQRVADLGGMKLVVLPSDAGGAAPGYFQLVDAVLGKLLAAQK